ncbi:type II toxin-antitoxin system RelE/ParE family toxin [Methylovulum miyakonense]|uniref:type II toxin-antitoxin system RelE/ParE family toxin n=1 Tax=Methylovulum miyakonense TaxID=645578 RepID=UPI000379219A|nr:type II toxin-antitoxin system mRNA interferase toxin, RelE/StbE family [Methylovulum miyakonense]
MIELIWDEAFVRSVKKWQKKHPELISRFKDRLRLFTEQPFHPSLKTHSLSGHLKGCSSFSINYEYRLIFKFVTDDKVLLIDIGTHDDVY